ncbi:hypothetical protein ABZ840_11765 [Streptomyces sp. NPDC047117]|uniref:hypothetical protein n=1 Tax=Streptomyces sp. NPDC047117 TaxID=3155379 RepID=UPI00340F4475
MHFRKSAVLAVAALALSAAIAPASAHEAGPSAATAHQVSQSSARTGGKIKLKTLKSPNDRTLTATLAMPKGYHFTVAHGSLVLISPGGHRVGKVGRTIELKNGKTAHVTYKAKGSTVRVHSSKTFKQLGATSAMLAKKSYAECANGKIKDYVVSGGIGGCIAGAETGCAPGATAGAFGGLVSGAVLSLADC